jgi:hypothetical protein
VTARRCGVIDGKLFVPGINERVECKTCGSEFVVTAHTIVNVSGAMCAQCQWDADLREAEAQS